MKDMPKSIFLLLLVVPPLIISTISPGKSDAKSSQIVISDWQFMWDNEQQEVVSPVNLQEEAGWREYQTRRDPRVRWGVFSMESFYFTGSPLETFCHHD